jgi:hypothetical protein
MAVLIRGDLFSRVVTTGPVCTAVQMPHDAVAAGDDCRIADPVSSAVARSAI